MGVRIQIDLLLPGEFSRYLTAPELLFSEVEEKLRTQKTPEVLKVVIDEVQKVPELLNVVHSLYERHEYKLQFLLLGSSARKLKRGGANLLSGRLIALYLFSLDYSEYPHELNKKLLLGSLPGVLVNNSQPQKTLRTYVHSYLKEEVMEESLVRRIEVFTRFLELCGQYHGKQMNASQISKAAGVSAQTILTYISILEDTLIAFKIPGWQASVKKQLRISPKFYFLDNGVEGGVKFRAFSSNISVW